MSTDIQHGSYRAKILADSISVHGDRLTTVLLRFPRFILAEVNTHRMLSRNSASSRAIPIANRIKLALEEPFVPDAFYANVKGMQGGEELDTHASIEARSAWLQARDAAVHAASILADIGVHKAWANRLLEPFMWHEAIISATDWGNVDALRTTPQAQPEFRIIWEMCIAVRKASTPTVVGVGEWHLPLVPDREQLVKEGFYPMSLAEISAARCGRVSYLTHEGKRDPGMDQDLFNRLIQPGHWSPLEHPATPFNDQDVVHERVSVRRDGKRYAGNFAGWVQLRKFFADEDDASR